MGLDLVTTLKAKGNEMATEDPTSERFKIIRKRAEQAARTQAQQEREGLQRRFASIGQVGSGAQIRAEAQAQERGAKRLAQAQESIGLAELAERQRRREIEEARQFQRGEREAGQRFGAEQAQIGREFGAGQALLGREFATGEREAGQEFAAGQALLGREFATGEREAAQEFAKTVEDARRKFASGERLSAQEFSALQLATQQEFVTGEREAAQEFGVTEREAAQEFAGSEAQLNRDFQAAQQAIVNQFKQQALDMQQQQIDVGIEQWEKEFARDSETIAFNKKMAEDEGGIFEDIFGTDFGLPKSPEEVIQRIPLSGTPFTIGQVTDLIPNFTSPF